MEDVVRELIYRLDISMKDIQNWLGDACGCPERKAKQASLRLWAVKFAQANNDEAEEFFYRMIGN